MQDQLQLTITSIGSIILFSMLFAILLVMVMKSDRLLGKVKYELLLLCMAAPVMKILIPIEQLPLTWNVNVPHVLPKMTIFLSKSVFSMGDKEVRLWHVILIAVLLSSLLNTIRVLLSYRLFLLEKTKLPEVTEKRVYELLDTILLQKDKKVRFTLRWTGEEDTPAVYGLFKPTILLPKRELSETELKCVLEHEVAHYLHGDLVIRFLWILIYSFCYWNPAVYILDAEFEKILEIRADENALKGKEAAFHKQYMETIVALSTENVHKDKKFSAKFYKNTGLAPRKRIEIIHHRAKRTMKGVVGTNLVTCCSLIALAVAMNCLIFEPRGEVPDVSNEGTFHGVEAVTNNNSFFIRNEDGTFDMYTGGVYRATLNSTLGSDIRVYESIEEASEYEEIQ